MNYSPKGCAVWDTWTLVRDNTVHLFHLQRRRPGADFISQTAEDSLGHATSTDLVNWTELPPAMGPDPSNDLDDRQPWTGCAVWHGSKGHLFYTMMGSRQPYVQRIGMATSADLVNWTRYAANPVIEPDPGRFSTPQAPIPGSRDCRDLLIIANPRGGFLGFYVTRRQHAEELPQSTVIACVESADLVHWRHREPAFASNKYACIEVPDVFELDGRWYLTALTGDWYGNFGIFGDPYATRGTVYAVSDRPEGPYRELDDNCLIVGDDMAPLSCRSVAFGGHRYVLYTDRERDNLANSGTPWFGTITTPKLLATRGEHLVAKYSPLIESRVTGEPIGRPAPPVRHTLECWGQTWRSCPASHWAFPAPASQQTISGQSRTGWGVTQFTAQGENFIYQTDVELSGRAAGLGFRMDDGRAGAVLAYDAADKCMYLFCPGTWNEDNFRCRRRVAFPVGRHFNLKLVVRREHIEGYIDDQLYLTAVRYMPTSGRFGLFADRSEARFTNIRAQALRVDKPQ